VKTWFRTALTAALMLGVAACQASVKEIIDPSLDQSNSARLVLYRTDTWIYSTEIPFLYLGDKEVGKLGRGDAIIQSVPVGTHTITARRPFLFVPAQAMSATSKYFEAGKTYYMRLDYQVSGMSGTYVSAVGRLSEADETAFNERR